MEHLLGMEPGRRWVEIRYTGRVTIDDFEAMPDLLVRVQHWAPSLPRMIYWDLAMFGDIDPVRAATLMLPRIQRDLRGIPGSNDLVLAHVCSDPLKRVVLKFWLALFEAEHRIRARLFRDEIQAVHWLMEQIPDEALSA